MYMAGFSVAYDTGIYYTPRCNLMDPRKSIIQYNNIIHRPEEALDIQSELIFVNDVVHLRMKLWAREALDIQSELIFVNDMVHLEMKLWYTNNCPFTSYTTVTPSQRLPKRCFRLRDVSFNISTYKIIACIEHATAQRANIMRVAREYKAGEGVLNY